MSNPSSHNNNTDTETTTVHVPPTLKMEGTKVQNVSMKEKIILLGNDPSHIQVKSRGTSRYNHGVRNPSRIQHLTMEYQVLPFVFLVQILLWVYLSSSYLDGSLGITDTRNPATRARLRLTYRIYLRGYNSTANICKPHLCPGYWPGNT